MYTQQQQRRRRRQALIRKFWDQLWIHNRLVMVDRMHYFPLYYSILESCFEVIFSVTPLIDKPFFITSSSKKYTK